MQPPLAYKLLLAALVSIFVLPSPPAESNRPQILNIAYVRFKSTDLPKAKEFYGTLLGLPNHGNSCTGVPQPCFVVNDQQHIELVSAAPGTPGPYLVEIGFAVNNINQMAAYLTANHYPTSEILARPDGSPFLELFDPEHNKIAFGPAQNKTTSSASTSAISCRIIHAGFVAHDINLENKFYEDLLGFHLYWKGGRTDAEVDWFMNQVPDGDNWIEYMLNIPSNADHRELGIQYHVSLGVPNIDQTAKLLKSRGAEFPKPITGRDGKRQLTLLDPDQTRIEVMEFAPVEKPCCSDYTGPQPQP